MNKFPCDTCEDYCPTPLDCKAYLEWLKDAKEFIEKEEKKEEEK